MKKFISYSGGVESTTMLLLFKDRAQAIFSDTEWEDESIYKQISKVEKILDIEIIKLKVRTVDGVHYNGGLPTYIKTRKFFPNFNARFCTRAYKIQPIAKYLKQYTPCELFIGFNKEEQALAGRGENLIPIEGIIYRYPLVELGLSRQNCIDILNEYKIMPNYPSYLSRGGCVGCYFKTKHEIKAMHHTNPSLLDELQHLEESVQDSREKFFFMFPNLKTSIKNFRKTIQSSPELFDTSIHYKSSTHSPCGAFCHK